MNINFLRTTIIFKILVIVVMFVSVAIWQKQYTNISLDVALTFWDTSNYKDICYNGYILESLPFPENIKLGAFYPGVALLFCAGNFVQMPSLIYIFNFVAFVLFAAVFYQFIKTRWYKEGGDDKRSQFLFWSFCLFPFSAFLHFNYSEIYFLLGSIWAFDLILGNKIWKSQIPALIIGFFRPTALPFGLFAWLLFTIETYKNRSNFRLGKYILQSFGFVSYAVGTICLYAFDHFKYGNWKLFLDSQQYYYLKQNNPNFVFQAVQDLMGKTPLWYDETARYSENIAQYGFYFYDKEFNLAFLLWFPFVVAIIGSIALISQKKYYWVLYSWGLLLPTLLSNTISFNRYLLTSFPLILAFNELFYARRLARYWLLGIYAIYFVLAIILFTHGFWVG
jgi:hypothetical protein